MQDWLLAQADVRPHAIALVCEGESLTYAQLHARAGSVTARLRGLGVQRGDRVALLPSNSAEAVVAIHAISKIGATMVLLNARLTAAELDAQLACVNARVLLCMRETGALANSLTSSVEHRVVVDHVDHIETLHPERQSKDASLPNQMVSGEINLEDDACILFTSGTSGTPKAAVLTWGNLWHSAMSSAYRIGVLPNDRWLCVLPLFHVGGLSIVLRSCLYGTTVDLRRKFDAMEIDAALRKEPITLISLVPTMLHRLLDVRTNLPKVELAQTRGLTENLREVYPTLRLALLGGAAANDDLMRRAHTASIPVATTYGLTEATSQVCTALPEDALRKPASVGKPLLFMQVRVIDAEGNDVPVNTEGEVIVRGPTEMRGYLDDEAATQQTIRGGWLHTGDFGTLDDDGDLYILQRRSDLIVSGGENIYPAEVEAVLQSHPAVSECLVVGIDSAEWGQSVAALVVATALVSERELMDFVRERIAAFKSPRIIRFVDALPMNAAGKLDRAAAKLSLTLALSHPSILRQAQDAQEERE